MRRNYRIIPAVLIVMMAIACAGKHPSDIVAPVIMTANHGWHFANATAISLYDTCKAAGDRCPAQLQPIVTNWNAVDNLADKVDAEFAHLDQAWLTLSEINTPENVAEVQATIQKINDLIDEIMAMVPALRNNAALESMRPKEVNNGR